MPDSTRPGESSPSTRPSGMEELERIFELVATAPVDQQEKTLLEACPDAAVQQQVRDLLQADSTDDRFLDHSLCPKPLRFASGERIGCYELLEKIGEGGMGVVFHTQQFEPVRRHVALKVIKPGVDTREVIARFDAERQALSMMDHPNIAKVLDAGSTDNGRPYFVMELVNGQPITSYCEQNGFSIKQRLDLFLTVCHAIQHAHQKGIIHRDIKPSNVLVAEYDGRPIAKVIDFGVAKAIFQPLTEMSVHTGFGQIVGTYEYMSPEQSRVDQLDVDTRSDIYSLGVLLYELLTGAPPFEKKRLRSVAWDEMLRIIREEDPPRPSSRLAAIHLHSTNLGEPDSSDGSPGSRQRDNGEAAKLGRVVRGELDWIVLKAMEKDRNRRYGTPNGLANDIESYLRGDAVSACPPSSMYRFRKFASRNKVVLATSAVVAASLVVGIISTSWQAIRATRAELDLAKSAAEARESAAEAQAVVSFLEEDLLGLASAESQLSAGLRPDPNLKLNTLLDRALSQVKGRLADRPELKAKLQATLASSFSSIGRYESASSLYGEVVRYLTRRDGANHPKTLHAMRQLARSHFDQSQLDVAEPIFDDAYFRSRKYLGDDDPLTMLLLNDLATLYQRQGRNENSETAYDACRKARQENLGSGHPDTLATLSGLATLYESMARFDEAEALHQRVLETRDRNLPSDHPSVADAMHSLGRCLLKRGRHHVDSIQFDRALPLLEEAVAINLRNSGIRGIDHPATIGIHRDLAQTYLEKGRHDDAIVLLEDLVDRTKRLWSDSHVSSVEAKRMLGWAYMQTNRLEEAENLLMDVLDSPSLSDPRDLQTLQVKGNLAITRYRLAKYEAAIVVDREVVQLAREVRGADHPQTLAAMVRLGLSYLETERTGAGRELLTKAFESGPESPIACDIAGVLADHFATAGETEKSLDWTERQRTSAKAGLVDDPRKLAEIIGIVEARKQELNPRNRAIPTGG